MMEHTQHRGTGRDVRAKVTFSRRVMLYEKEIYTKEPDETDGDGDGTNWRFARIRRGSGR